MYDEAEVREIKPICRALGDMTIEELDLSVRTFNCLKRANFNTVADLYDYLSGTLDGEPALIDKWVGRKSLTEALCKVKALGCPLIEVSYDHATAGTPEKEKRVSKIGQVAITVEKPDYGSDTNGIGGFTLFATIHNRGNQLIRAEMKEFMIFSGNRQWAASSDLTGYSFSAEHIMPMSAKTAAKIWSGTPWDHTTLQDGDYLTIVLSIDNVSHAFKFVLRDGLFTIDDYCTY